MEEKELPLEIEKKFLIRMPDLRWIEKNTDVKIAKISQTYLGLKKDGFGDRVRKMTINNVTKYYHTSKKSLSNMTRIEIENEISRNKYYEYMSLKSRRGTLHKTRYIININNLKYEIDVYPFWEETAILEIELENENQKYVIPEFIEVIGDVTGNRDYSNSSLVSKFYDKKRYPKVTDKKEDSANKLNKTRKESELNKSRKNKREYDSSKFYRNRKVNRNNKKYGKVSERYEKRKY